MTGLEAQTFPIPLDKCPEPWTYPHSNLCYDKNPTLPRLASDRQRDQARTLKNKGFLLLHMGFGLREGSFEGPLDLGVTVETIIGVWAENRQDLIYILKHQYRCLMENSDKENRRLLQKFSL